MEKQVLERAKWLWYSLTYLSKEECVRKAYEEFGDDHILAFYDIDKEMYLKSLEMKI